MKFLSIIFKAGQIIKQIKSGQALIWVCDRPCFVSPEKALVFKLAQQKGVQFKSSDEFEKWYTNYVEESDFPFPVQEKAQKSFVYYTGGDKANTLFWV